MIRSPPSEQQLSRLEKEKAAKLSTGQGTVTPSGSSSIRTGVRRQRESGSLQKKNFIVCPQPQKED